jgi:hypothetical protein
MERQYSSSPVNMSIQRYHQETTKYINTQFIKQSIKEYTISGLRQPNADTAWFVGRQICRLAAITKGTQ